MQSENRPVLLAIESSCDDTAAAVMQGGVLLSNITAQQIVHARFGGVIPELASRKHQENILNVVDAALKEGGTRISDLDAIAFTRGPGLLGSLLVGMSYAKGLALSLDIPLIAVDHLQAHVLAHFIEEPRPAFPFLCLTVSGGHTQIIRVDAPLEMTILGKTIDDAAGEAFDKTGKMLGLPYPSGPVIDSLARQGTPKYKFTEPRVAGLDFSFSGLKTSIKYFLRDQMALNPHFIKQEKAHICASVQETIVNILLHKMDSAAHMTGIREIAIAGGVSANSSLRERFETKAREQKWNIYIPKLQYCTDNAAMIAMAAHYKYLAGKFSDLSVTPEVRLQF
ncbi:MAG TPA: tRNA (adenosine(37)-N6)-threonylcarbamoyltransferase complex transferase subunit TsaD [Saprospiraceae bacterium]|nr:tRNA (adenosine(37)-N6)-threonylcarbamoyltransferase complex transferase subunit TsaD [Saprospiraceae bacterium]